MANPITALPQVNKTATSSSASSLKERKSLVATEKGASDQDKDFEIALKQGLEERKKEEKAVVPSEAQMLPLQNAIPDQKQVSSKNTSLEGVSPQPSKAQGLISQQANLEKTQGKELSSVSEQKQVQASKIKPELLGQLKHQAQVSQQPQKVQATAASAVSAEQLQAMAASTESFGDQDYEIESLDVNQGSAQGLAAGLKNSLDEKSAQKVASSKLSTADYLNLRDISKKDSISLNANQLGESSSKLDLGTFGKSESKKTRLSGIDKESVGATALTQNFQLNSHAKVVEGMTTQGTAGKTILSHDAVHQLTHQVSLLSQAKQDGEIKIRLRPDHLGELQMSVRTQGQNVAIQIKAHDQESKKIIEDSLSSLRSSLSAQNLTLSQVEVVSQAPQAQNEQGAQMDLSGQRQNSGQDQSGQFREQNQSARQDRLYEETMNSRNINLARVAPRQNTMGMGQLDMIA